MLWGDCQTDRDKSAPGRERQRSIPEPFPAMREAFPTMWESFPPDRECFPGRREHFPRDRENFPARRERFPGYRERFPRHRERFPAMRECFPTTREPLSAGGKSCPATGNGAQNERETHQMGRKVRKTTFSTTKAHRAPIWPPSGLN